MMRELRRTQRIMILLPIFLSLLVFFAFVIANIKHDFFLPFLIPFAFLGNLTKSYLVFLLVSAWAIKFVSVNFRIAYIGLYNPLALSIALIAYRLLYGRHVPSCMHCDFLRAIASGFGGQYISSLSFAFGLVVYVVLLSAMSFYLVHRKSNGEKTV